MGWGEGEKAGVRRRRYRRKERSRAPMDLDGWTCKEKGKKKKEKPPAFFACFLHGDFLRGSDL